MKKLYTILGMLFATLFIFHYVMTGVPHMVYFGLMLFFPVIAKLEERK